MKNKILLFSVLLLSFLSNAQNSKEVSQEWISISQFLDVTVAQDTKFKLIGYAKANLVDDKAMAALWARVDNEGDELGFFDNMGDRPIHLNEWKSYTIEGVLTKDAETLNFGALCYGNGTYLFDNFQLFIENAEGVLAPVTIDNSSFESEVSKGVVPKWSQGIGRGKAVKVKEFEISSSSDAAAGKKSVKLVGTGIELSSATIGNVEGASPQIGAMISMLEDLKSRVESRVKNMSQYELDHLHDEKANRIGALIMHLAAAEKYYQVFTFEGRGFNEEENKIWLDALDLGAAARDKYKGHEVQYYLDIYNEVRAETIAELKKRDDKWFEKIQPSADISNHYCWFHVMEHQSSHLGQILFLAKRIPTEVELHLPDLIKD
ncbi:DUF664 domain-containing protein [Cellulophaga sp. Z1A5H]|uniref:mycothiol transferase n=1 Tax=Cellulophaga sp. Z1A5H TaxID=2687291 RepID=UPI0013FE3505|nr:DUF664 domain-containing protein [Cellulophaga sp. Z1A5H]